MSYVISLLPAMMDGLKNTILIFLVTLVLSLPLGFLIGILRTTKNKILSTILSIYISIMRGTPLMLQIVFIFYGLPVVGITFDRYPAVLLAFVLNYTAYFAEIFRGGILSIDRGQYEAGRVLGFNRLEIFTKLIMPQVVKVVLPSISNEIITLIKDTSLVYIVGIGELLRAGKIASNRDASLVPFAMVGIIYLLFTGVVGKILFAFERRLEYYE